MQISEGFSRQEIRVSWENRLNTRKRVQLLLSKTALSLKSKDDVDYFLVVFITALSCCNYCTGILWGTRFRPNKTKESISGPFGGMLPNTASFGLAPRRPGEPPRALPSSSTQYTIHPTYLSFGVLRFFSVFAETTEGETFKDRYNVIDMCWRNLLKVQDQRFVLEMMLFWSWVCF